MNQICSATNNEHTAPPISSRRRAYSWLIASLAVCVFAPAGLGQHAPEWTRLEPNGPTGRCSVEVWKSNWPGCKFEDGVAEGHLAIGQRAGSLAWRVTCKSGEIGPERGGVGWRWPLPATATGATVRSSIELRYSILFEPGFEFVKGGKLPGVCGGPKTITGGATCSGYDGWSVRLMWRRDGCGQAYVYHPLMKSKYGDEFDFPSSFQFPTGQPIHVRMQINMNSPAKQDGALRVWTAIEDKTGQLMAEQLMVDERNMQWTKDPSIGIDSLLFNVFHGGNDSSWAPSKDVVVSFANISFR